MLRAEAPAPIEAFATIYERLAVHYPEDKLTLSERRVKLEDWRRLMGHLPTDILAAAADAYLMSSARFFPTPGQLHDTAQRFWRHRELMAQRARDTLALIQQQVSE